MSIEPIHRTKRVVSSRLRDIKLGKSSNMIG